MKLIDILPEKDERIFITGKSKSGKSTLVRQLISQLPDNTIIIVIDSKHEWKIRRIGSNPKLGNKNVYRLLLPNIKLIRRPGIYVYQSRYPHFYDPFVTKILLSAYNRKNVTIVVHEAYHFCHGANPLPALGQAATQGRAKNLRLFIESQRPSLIYLGFITEANVWVEFRLQKPEDRKKIADNSGFPELMIPVEKAHDFWVAKDEWDAPIYIRNTKVSQDDINEWDLLTRRKKTTGTQDQNQAPTMQ